MQLQYNIHVCSDFVFAHTYHVAPLSKKKFKLMSSSDASPIKVAIDFGFEDLMTDKVQPPCMLAMHIVHVDQKVFNV